MKKDSFGDRGSKAVQCLEKAWEELRCAEPDIPPAVIVLLPAYEKTKAGTFSASSWKYSEDRKGHEVGISPTLFTSPLEVLEVMLHEAAHAIMYDKDGFRGGGYYHGKEFRHECLRLGLSCTMRNRRYGYDRTGWPENRTMPKRYAQSLKTLEKGLPK